VSGYTSNGAKLRFKHERFIELAEAKGWVTQTQQAEGTGLAQPTINRILKKPEDWTPRYESIAALLSAFDVPFEELFEFVTDCPARCRRAS
jgi:transcriptional regulator with XRE-family HTH domain